MKYHIHPAMKQLVSILLAVITLGCQNNHFDSSYLSDKPCAAPCWLDIIPTVTSEQDLQKIINDPSLFNTKNLEIDRSIHDGETIVRYFAEHESGLPVSFIVVNGTVQSIRFAVNGSVNLENVLASYRSSSFINSFDETEGQNICYSFNLNYPELGIIVAGGGCKSSEKDQYLVKLQSSNHKVANIHNQIPVKSVTFVATHPNLEQMLYSTMSADFVPSTLSNYENWRDLGYYTLN